MSKHEWEKTKTIFWSDELNDDFDQVGLERPDVPKNYKYLSKNIFFNLTGNIVYYIIAKPILRVYCFLHGIRYQYKHNLLPLKGKGAILYANHVAITDAFKYACGLFFKRVYTIAYSDALEIPIVNKIGPWFGFLPLPKANDHDNIVKLIDTIRFVTERGHKVIIFPEAHIWPYYTEIRNFIDNSFYYPSLLNLPVIPAVTTWKKSKLSKKPRQLIKIGRAIYPDMDDSIPENKKYLHEECLNSMKILSNEEPQYEYIKYIHKTK